MDRRQFGLLGLAAACGSVTARAAMPSTMVANVRALGARGDGVSDDTIPIQQALQQFDRVYLPPGTYAVNNLILKSGNELFGSGTASVLLQRPEAQWAVSANPGSAGTANPANNIRHLFIHDLQFQGQAGKAPFNEHVHLLNLNAVSIVMISRCSFVGYVGDGIYLGSGNNNAIERHNQQVLIQNCSFDGVIRNNRNGISIIDGTGVTVRYCNFVRSGNVDMPAGIDIEPNPETNAFVRTEWIWIDHCRFADMGSFSMIGITLQPQQALGQPAGHFLITNCYATQPGSHDQVMFYLRQGNHTSPNPAAAPLGLRINNCRSDGIPGAATLISLSGLTMSNCSFNQAVAPVLDHCLNTQFVNVTVNGKSYQPA